MENQRLKDFLTERGHFDLLREFEVYCASPASPDAQAVVFDPDMEATDGSTYFRVTPSSKKPKKVNNAKASIPAKSTQSIYDAPESWRKSSQPTTASQGAVDTGNSKAPAPATAKNNNISDEADVTAPRPRTARPEASNCGLKLQAKTVADFRNLQNLLVTLQFAFHTYSLKEEQEIRVVLRGVPKEIPVDEIKEDLLSQHLPVQSVRRIQNRFREPLNLVLVSGTAEANDKATKAAFFKIRSVCALSGVKAEQPRKRALPGQCHNCQSYGHSSRHCFNPACCVKCLGNHGTAQCTRN
ncbi:Nucleic-acid-binding protein from transposon X-element [Eumeta japonica]|uniref:Nucleic-acid-binding protein from transposon X-element n=1 Tax=Eumeta variegata TaxID=151549 RepID=A0A4C1XK65_EUMVA|nr:Nucleic-acid-binding protein from transposon X-element [Eumeta japonica]